MLLNIDVIAQLKQKMRKLVIFTTVKRLVLGSNSFKNGKNLNDEHDDEEQVFEIADTSTAYAECLMACTPFKFVSNEEYKKCFKNCFKEKLDEVIGQ